MDPRAEMFVPPAVYGRWWTMVQSCSGLAGSLSDITWYQVPGTDVVEQNGRSVGGYWAPVSNSIVLAGNGMLEGSIVRHEMLHALIRARSGHLRQQFLERCGGIVTCGPGCVQEAGPPQLPAPSVVRVGSDAVRVDAHLIPDVPLVSEDDNFFTIAITATNDREYPIVVVLNPSSPNRTFSYTLLGEAGGLGAFTTATDAGIWYFKARETKQQYFDLRIGITTSPPNTLALGLYGLHAGFADNVIFLPNIRLGESGLP
jgi:hypothetical protein